MTVFKTERPNDYYYLGILLMRSLVTLLLCWVVYFLIHKSPITLGNLAVSAFVILIGSFIPEITKERIIQIAINDQRSITFTYKALFAKAKQETIDTSNLNIEISKNKFSKSLFTKNTALAFNVNNKEKFIVSRYKDGYSVNSLKQICASFIDTPVPILQ